MAEYRHELKYYLSYPDYMLLQKRLAATVPRDIHAGESGKYFIRSLYFDDVYDSAFTEKLSGEDLRDKVRLRYYNLVPDKIKLERKKKTSGYILKESITLSKSECDLLLSGDCSFLLKRSEPFAHVMYTEFVTRVLRPKVIVDYTREPFIFPYENVRITFDTQIRTGYHSIDIFNPDIPTYPVIERDMPVLEVKFNKALPRGIHAMLQEASPTRSQISKYCLCRQFEL
ncbi:MAG: polyphosphate polymerase domain-containing protein [Clostridia bacterium]|nr:polyphosphate polymerase domain-containing protein [Clostridia bacterium]